ncbi:helix-turn-helix transcriptional regulator [Desulfoluna spongiiphila]|uniref:DNA binding domain-containing protein, excisionase family n=1 Tax=Desulfoluna spongiiphila TaxID=419481 RepID=A0A1G5CR67_9BACT|nr:helix-turn-helix transcriptional regulator [Desulfoluna spongiiphila]SCY04807.1 DNA binding domain-containing protein, excisionase family [Desulfoluna spongiiphila]VVS92341.1 pbp domain [Desulfoluna spongiiphila]
MKNRGSGKDLLTTREVADFLGVNEKMVYQLISDKGLPASKVTGKWLFPRYLVEQWVENSTINYPDAAHINTGGSGPLVVAGSNDLLLDRVLSQYNKSHRGELAVFGNVGSMGGIQALKSGMCHIASSHLVSADDQEYNFEFAGRELERQPVVINFCHREQGIVYRPGWHGFSGIADLAEPGVRVVNRPLGTGTRLLFDRELKACGIEGGSLAGYGDEVSRHMDVGLAVLSGRADAGPGIRTVADLLGLGFFPLRRERFDLLVLREFYFDRRVQGVLGLLRESSLKELLKGLAGYDIEGSGLMRFPDNP